MKAFISNRRPVTNSTDWIMEFPNGGRTILKAPTLKAAIYQGKSLGASYLLCIHTYEILEEF